MILALPETKTYFHDLRVQLNCQKKRKNDFGFTRNKIAFPKTNYACNASGDELLLVDLFYPKMDVVMNPCYLSYLWLC